MSITPNPLSYLGIKEQSPPNIIKAQRAPLTSDIKFDIGDIWINTVSQLAYQLVNKANNTATWNVFSGNSSAAAITTVTAGFTGWLDGTDTDVQLSLNSLDQILQGGIDGAIPISSAGTSPVLNTITAGAGISVTNGPGTITIGNTLLPAIPITVPDGGTGNVTLTQHGIMIGNGVNAVNVTAAPTNGQTLIGSTGNDPVLNTLTAGAGINVTNGPGTITITNTGALPVLPITVPNGGTGDVTLTQHGIMIGNGVNAVNVTAAPTNGQILIGSTGNDPTVANITTTAGQGIAITNGAGTLDISGITATTGVKGISQLATLAETKIGTNASHTITPSTLTDYAADMQFTGFVSWSAGGPYFDVATLGTFKLLVGGTGYILGKQITWVAQNFVGMTAGNTYYIYIDNTGTIQGTASRTDALYVNNIVLFECLRDSTGAGNNQYVVKENHPYSFSSNSSNYLHKVVNTVIDNYFNGANITLNGTQEIQINGDDTLEDHGLSTVIPHSGGVAVNFIQMFTLGSGKWATASSSPTFTGQYNNAGVVASLPGGRWGVYTLYVTKDNLNTTTPLYFAVLNTAHYGTSAAASNAISTGTTSVDSNELSQLELCQLGYIIYRQSTNAITSVIIAKSTLRETISSPGSSDASLVNTNTSTFTRWLSAADTTVQAALNTLDQILQGGANGSIPISSAGVSPVLATLTAGAGIGISNGPGTITISSAVSGIAWQLVGASQALSVNHGYICNAGANLVFTLPGVSAVGDTVSVIVNGATSWQITQAAGQSIGFGSSTTAVGVGGSLTSSAQGDAVTIVCMTANTKWLVINSIGNIIIA